MAAAIRRATAHFSVGFGISVGLSHAEPHAYAVRRLQAGRRQGQSPKCAGSGVA